MDIFYGLEKYKNAPNSHLKETAQPIEEKQDEASEESKWEKFKDFSKGTLGCLMAIGFWAMLICIPIFFSEIGSGGDISGDIGPIVFVIFAATLSILLFYGVWKFVNKNVSENKSKKERVLMSILFYIIIVALIAYFIYLSGAFDAIFHINDGHYMRGKY